MIFYCLVGLATVVLFLLLLKKFIMKRFYAIFVSYARRYEDKEVTQIRLNHIQDNLKGIVSQNPEIRERNGLTILEIGIGSGVNFRAYPEATDLVAVDPNPHFRKFYKDNRKNFSNIASETIIQGVGEKMDEIPSNSVDVAVTTHVMCIAESNSKMFQEIKRVLVPGGKYIFFEHIREWDTKNHYLRQLIQDFLVKSYVFPAIMDNCCCNRDCLNLLERSGYSKVQAKRIYMPYASICQLVSPHLMGVAIK